MLRLMTYMSGSFNFTIDELADKMDMSYRTIYRYIDTFKQATDEQKARKIDIADLISGVLLEKRKSCTVVSKAPERHTPTAYEILWEIYDVNFRTLVTDLYLVDL